jgi:hypothetical protein
MAANIDKNLLVGGWLHAHEEDQPGEMVFRPNSRQLPPARGRRGYEFHPDGSLTQISSGPADRSTASQGHWSAGPQGHIKISIPGQPDEIFEVVAQDKDRLVIKK